LVLPELKVGFGFERYLSKKNGEISWVLPELKVGFGFERNLSKKYGEISLVLPGLNLEGFV